ncbi:MAG TPA: hypothetical protein VMJ31_10510 [Methylocystis sp.]|nr:hypothetical protein [Methylocystis sp.]
MAKALPIVNKPNFFQLQGDGVFVSYATTSITGTPQFAYQDANISKSFSGNAIRLAETEIGSLVSVTIALTVDQGSTDFTLFVPQISLRLFESVPITTIGVTTVHRFSIIGPPHGQNEFYHPVTLSGTAAFVEL